MIEVALQEYPDRETMVWGLAELVGDQLRAAHASHGRATLAVPGGSTPGPFLEALSEADLDSSEDNFDILSEEDFDSSDENFENDFLRSDSSFVASNS